MTMLDDDALVERVARAIAAADPEYDPDWDYTEQATAAIEAVRVHMWDDGK